MDTLETLCIDLIMEKFERFYFAFTVSKDENLQRNFQFLQRKFSVEILKDLCNDRKLKEEYFDLLINEHLKYLKGKWLKNSKYWNSTVDIFRRLPNLTRIRFRDFRDCGDEILENVARFCPNIVEIDVNESSVTDNGVQYLCEIKNGMAPCPKLKNIFVEYSDVTDNGVENLLRNFPLLEKIRHSNVPALLHSIHEENISESENLKFFNLVELNLIPIKHSPNYTDVLETCLTVCPKLETLCCYILDEEDLNLFNNSHLKKLLLEFSLEDRKINMHKFLKMSGWKLTYLEITDCTMSIYILGENCPNLKYFKGLRVNFTDDNDDLILNFASLTGCKFKEIKPSSNKALGLLLSSSPKLESIIIELCKLSLELKSHILLWCKNPCANIITLVDAIETISEIQFLKDILYNCPSLKWMRVFNYSDPEFFPNKTVETLEDIAESLPNKPSVLLNNSLYYVNLHIMSILSKSNVFQWPSVHFRCICN